MKSIFGVVMVYCPNCGARNPDENEFCGKCGIKLPKPEEKPKARKRKPKPAKKEITLSRKTIYGGIAIAVVIVGLVAAYFLLIGGGSSVELTFTPSTLQVGDKYTVRISVTNNESSTMTISSGTTKIYRNGQLLETFEELPPLKTRTISAGETKLIFEETDTVDTTEYIGGEEVSMIGNWKFELSFGTNFGTLSDSATLSVTA